MRDSTCCNASANYPRFQTAGESFVNAFGTRTILNRAIPNASPIFDRLGFENDVRYENDDDFKEGAKFPNRRARRRHFRGNQHLRCAELGILGLSYAVSTMEIGLRYRRAQQGERLCAFFTCDALA
jgi:hypothetical protein